MFEDWVDNLFRLSNKIFGLMERTAANADFDVTAQDSRLVALSGMQESVLSCGFWLSTYHSIAENHQDESIVLKYARSQTVSQFKNMKKFDKNFPLKAIIKVNKHFK